MLGSLNLSPISIIETLANRGRLWSHCTYSEEGTFYFSRGRFITSLWSLFLSHTQGGTRAASPAKRWVPALFKFSINHDDPERRERNEEGSFFFSIYTFFLLVSLALTWTTSRLSFLSAYTVYLFMSISLSTCSLWSDPPLPFSPSCLCVLRSWSTENLLRNAIWLGLEIKSSHYITDAKHVTGLICLLLL